MHSVLALDIQHLAKLYDHTAALKNITLQLEASQTLALLGPNGSGKTTLLKIVAGAMTPTLGQGSIFGRDMVADRIELRSVVGFLSAETYLYDDLSAAENVRFALTMAGRKVESADLASALEAVSLAQHANDRVRSFSSGMKRRLSLARFLLLRPQLLLLDEPYNSLDEAGAKFVDDAVRSAARAGHATILATHDAERALALADVVAVLERGMLTHFGPARGYRVSHVQHVG